MSAETPLFRHGDRGVGEPEIEPAGPSVAGGKIPATRSAPAGNSRRILIVQGDWEAGMSLLAQDLQDAGHKVGKVVLCAPDLLYRFRGIEIHPYRKPLAGFDSWLRELVGSHGYDTFFLYNHYRPYNQIAWDLAHELDLDCQVFELGLIRPNCVMTFSRQETPIEFVPRAWKRILDGGPPPATPESPPELCKVSTPVKLFFFISHFLLSRFTSPLFPHFVDQRRMNLWHHFKHGMIHLWRFIERNRDAEYDPLLAGEWSGGYYAVPLQVHSDTQITKCSDFRSIEQFIRLVAASFAQHAPRGTKLIFKVHPMDRGYKDYTDLITGLDHRLGGGKLFYVDRVHLPTLLEHARGVVNINSSVGISGLIHHTPVITLGRAVYDLPELTFHGSLDEFWTQASPPSKERVRQFVNLLLATNQGRGTLSQRCFDVPGRCRIQWPPPFQQRYFPRPTED